MVDEQLTQEDKAGQPAPAGTEYGRLDAAGKSLTDALRISFGILKIIMFVLVVLFVASGVFKVQENEQAIVLWLGKVRGPVEGRILKPGLHWTFPEPVCEIIKIPVTDVQTLPINSFWYFETEQEKLGQPSPYAPDTLDPTRDGYCLTRNDTISGQGANDYNIVHSRWEVKYRISDPERFFRNISCRRAKPGESFIDAAAETLQPLLESMASDAIVTTMVNYSIDQAIVSTDRIPNDVAKLLQDRLDLIESGITVETMQVSGKITWPRQVNDAFQASNRASQEKQTIINQAIAYASTTLNEAGGSDAENVLAELKKPGITEDEREKLLSQLAGKSQEIISQARAERTTLVKTAEANANYLGQLLPEYRKRPELVLQKLYQDAIQSVLENAQEKIFIQPGQTEKPKEFRIQVNRDPSIGKKQQQ